LVRLLVKIYEGVCDACMYVSCRSGRRGRRIRKQLREARSFDEWCDIARELDRVEGREAWKSEDESPYYDFMLLRHSIADIRACRRSGDFVALTKALAGVYTRNAAHTSINNQQLYAETNFGTKDLISDFVQEVVEATVLFRDSTAVPHAAKVGFFKQVRTAYGRTALCLSGGATMAYYHFGVVKALIEARCMPAIVSGASGGAMVAAWVGVRTDAELAALLVPELADQITPCEESWWVCLQRLVKTGALFDWNLWVDKCRVATLGDTTFEEAFRRTGRILNIPMTSAHKHAQSVVLNYRTAPKVVIWSAVLASRCAG